ncbi:MAG: S24/S26 family peptidase [Chloroflexota bacterium]
MASSWNEPLRPGKEGLIAFKVKGDSMVPILHPGDIVHVDPGPGISYRVGDVVLIFRKEELITHRLLYKVVEGWYTKGDNRLDLDPVVNEQSMIGKVVVLEKAGKRIDLQKPFWRSANRVMGSLHWLFVLCFDKIRLFASWSRLNRYPLFKRCGRKTMLIIQKAISVTILFSGRVLAIFDRRGG